MPSTPSSLAIGSSPHFIHDRRLEVHHHATGNVLPSACLREEGVEGVISAANGLVARHLAIGLNAMFQAEQLPASVADLDAGLADVDAESFTHCVCVRCSSGVLGGCKGTEGPASQCDRSNSVL